MNRIKFDSETIRLITIFESVTGARIKDCILNENIIFITEENEMGKAIGKNGINIKSLEKKLNKKIKLVEYSNDLVEFVKNIIYPIDALEISEEEKIVTIRGRGMQSKAMLIGRDRQNINHIRDIVRRYFDVKEIKVL